MCVSLGVCSVCAFGALVVSSEVMTLKEKASSDPAPGAAEHQNSPRGTLQTLCCQRRAGRVRYVY